MPSCVSNMERHRLGILRLAPIETDGKVLRQIEYAAREYEVTVVGWGHLDKARPHVEMRTVQRHVFPPGQRLVQVALMFGGRFAPSLWERWYWRKPDHRQALTLLAGRRPLELIHVNEALTLPIGIEAARRMGARVLFDAHEYTPLLEEDKLWGRLLAVPFHHYLIRQYAHQADAMITVCPGIAERYQQVFGLEPAVITNAPAYRELPHHPVDPARIRIIHHGMAMRDRRLEEIIEIASLLDSRYTLDFILVDKDPGYIDELKGRAARVAMGRVSFLDPVPPAEIAPTINRYDVGLPWIPPVNFNYARALPNKFFESIMAGLAIAIGPSPEMARIVRQYKLGVVADSFEPAAMARLLNALPPEEINRMKQCSLLAARELNADVEMGKLLDIYRRLLPAPGPAKQGGLPALSAKGPSP
jgi:glycosyltransferase involved in cell wall biosynthesis